MPVTTDAPVAERPAGFHRVARGGVANLGGAAASSILNLVLVIVIARALPESQAGIVFTTTTLFLVATTLARLGTDVSIVHFLAGATALNRGQDVRAYLRVAVVPVLVAAALSGVVIAVAAPRIFDEVLGAPGLHGQALLIVLGATVPVTAAYELALAATRGLDAFSPTVLLERLARPALQVVFVFAVVEAGGRAFAVVCAWAGPYLIVAALAVFSLVRLLPRASVGSADELDVDTTGFWRFTLPRAMAGVIQFLLQRLDILLVGAYLGAAPAAIYTAATRFVVVGQLGSQAIWWAVQPRLAMLVAADELHDARRLYRLSTAWVIALTWPLFLVSIVAAPIILGLLGHGYRSGAHVMIVLGVAMLVSGACGLVDVVLITVGKTTWNLGNTLLALTVNLAIDIPLIPRIGIIGAAIGWAAAIAVRNLVAVLQVGGSFHFYPLDRLSLRLGALSVALFAAAPGVVALFAGYGPATVVPMLAVGSAVYSWQLWRMRSELYLDLISAASR